jgi:translation initiation factor IF-3
MAREAGLDLVEVAPLERPPVCRIMDYGKHKYLLKKKQKHQGSHEITLKEVRLRPKTDDHDREIKLKRAERFLEEGHKVQFTMLFRGRERQHRDLAMEAFNEIVARFGEQGKIERTATFEGKRMTMVLAPAKAAAKSKTPETSAPQAAAVVAPRPVPQAAVVVAPPPAPQATVVVVPPPVS